MINTYEAYLRHPAGNILKIEDAMNIYSEIIRSINDCTVDYKMEIWINFLKNAAHYANIRNRWEWMSIEEKRAEDRVRTGIHGKFITSVNILSRIADKEELDVSWRERLGDDRKRIGDFACFVVYMTGISNR